MTYIVEYLERGGLIWREYQVVYSESDAMSFCDVLNEDGYSARIIELSRKLIYRKDV